MRAIVLLLALLFSNVQLASAADDIADVVWFLAAGTTLVTGQVVVVDGGRTM